MEEHEFLFPTLFKCCLVIQLNSIYNHVIIFMKFNLVNVYKCLYSIASVDLIEMSRLFRVQVHYELILEQKKTTLNKKSSNVSITTKTIIWQHDSEFLCLQINSFKFHCLTFYSKNSSMPATLYHNFSFFHAFFLKIFFIFQSLEILG